MAAVPSADDIEEVRRRGDLLLQSINEQLLDLSAQEFPTASPKAFIAYLGRIVAGLSHLLSDTDNAELAKLICQFSKEIASHLRFLESASYPRIPWALIKPMENLITAIVPGSRIVLRSQWLWNYKIRPISEQYKEALETLPHEYFETSVWAPKPTNWNVVSLPRVDAGNILMHVILGHEVGHRIAERFLKKLDDDPPTRDAIAQKINHSIGDASWADPDIGKMNAVRALALKGRLYKLIDGVRIGALQELISDVVALHLFGPSFAFALYESALDDSLDGLPQYPDYHPQWRYRYRFAMKEFTALGHGDLLQSIGGSPVTDAVKAKVTALVAKIEALAAIDSDKAARENDPLAKRAYPIVEDLLPQIPTFVAEQVAHVTFDKLRFAEKLREQLELLALGIPPASIEKNGGDFRYTILAGWCYKTARLRIPMIREAPEWSVGDDITLGRLVHKALEYRMTAEDYTKWKERGAK